MPLPPARAASSPPVRSPGLRVTTLTVPPKAPEPYSAEPWPGSTSSRSHVVQAQRQVHQVVAGLGVRQVEAVQQHLHLVEGRAADRQVGLHAVLLALAGHHRRQHLQLLGHRAGRAGSPVRPRPAGRPGAPRPAGRPAPASRAPPPGRSATGCRPATTMKAAESAGAGAAAAGADRPATPTSAPARRAAGCAWGSFPERRSGGLGLRLGVPQPRGQEQAQRRDRDHGHGPGLPVGRIGGRAGDVAGRDPAPPCGRTRA